MNKNRGFTLIELAVVVAIIAILAAIAIPSYLNQTRKARRMEVKGAMQQIALVQERFRADCTVYASGFSFACPAAAPPTFPAVNTFYTSPYYLVTFTSGDATSYKIKAAAQGTQTKDSSCTPLFYDFGVTTPGAVTKTPTDCWAK